MIVCSCQQVSDFDIELALLDILNEPEAPIPTPGVVYRYMQKRMQCCGCAPLAVDVIYAKVEDLEKRGLVCPFRSFSTRERLARIRQQRNSPRAPTYVEDYETCE
jgi:bacterioferritin-associated ferredoxin